VRADGPPGGAAGRFRGAIFAGDNPYSRRAWVSLRIRVTTGPAIKDAVAAVPDVRRGFLLKGGPPSAPPAEGGLMGYVETQDEIIRLRLRGHRSAGLRQASVHASLNGRATPPGSPAVRREGARHSASATVPVQPVAAPAADHDEDADLVAAVDAARRLRHMTAVQQIVDAAGLTLEQLRGRGRGRNEVAVRRIVAAYLRRRGCSLPEIGRVVNRDHTTVLNLLQTPARVTRQYQELAS
jgi:hypothetical protein